MNELRVGDTPSQDNGEVLGNSGLPSDVSDAKAIQNSNDWNALLEKEPEYMKQFKSLEDFKDKYKQLHNQYSNTVREIKEKEKKSQADMTANEQKQAMVQEQQDTIMSIVPQFLQNDMKLTPDMEKVLTEKGLDIRDVKLGALELKERIVNAHSIVGGQEEYTAMLSWAKDNISDAQKVSFDKDVTSGMSEFAIRGLYSMYKNGESSAPADRIRGDSSPQSIRGYGSLDEVLRDRKYLNTAKGRMDNVAQAKHQQRLNITPSSVLDGR